MIIMLTIMDDKRAQEDLGKYAWIKRDQIDWYLKRSQAYEWQYNKRIPSLAFFHIPLMEYAEVREKAITYGEMGEEVCSPKTNSGLFSAFVERQDVVGTFVDHDHANDYWGEWFGIKLCYGRVTGYNNYMVGDGQRGARIIQLKQGERNFETWIRLDNGTVYEPVKHVARS